VVTCDWKVWGEREVRGVLVVGKEGDVQPP